MKQEYLNISIYNKYFTALTNENMDSKTWNS